MDKSSTNLWLAEPRTTLAQTLIDNVLSVFFLLFFFFIKCLLSVMNVFISRACPHLSKEFSLCVRLRWRQDPLSFFIVFVLMTFKLNLKRDSNIAINHNLWRFFLCVGELMYVFPTLKKMVYGIYTWQSVEFFLLLFNWVGFLPTLSWVLTNWTQRGCELWPPSVCLSVDLSRMLLLPVQSGGYCMF